VNTLAELASTASKIARQLLFMNRPEVGEVTATVGGGITSSAMPHKRTPKLASRIISLAMLARGHAGAMTEVMETDDERSMANWYAEFVAIPEACMVAGRTMANLADVAEDLEVHPARMAENLRLHGTIVTSERVMMALADEYGRPEAHDLVREHTMAAFDTGVDFADSLRSDERVTSVLSDDEIGELTDPLGYVGEAATMVERVIERHT
jgi:adenylosuccinate lyase